MEAKEKAKELADKFFAINNEKESKLGTNPFISRNYAKECVKIVVNEIIDAYQDIDPKKEFWKSVLKEIDNI